MNAIRWGDWKVTFAMVKGNIATGERIVTNWPLITHLRADPYETMWEEGEMGHYRWLADNMRLFVPVQDKLREFFTTIPQYPFQEGSSLNAGGINYNSLRAMKALNMLEELEERFPVNRLKMLLIWRWPRRGGGADPGTEGLSPKCRQSADVSIFCPLHARPRSLASVNSGVVND